MIGLDDLWTVRRFARWKYELGPDEEPSKPQMNSVERMCKEGTLPAVKVGREWRIDTAEILRGVRHAV